MYAHIIGKQAPIPSVVVPANDQSQLSLSFCESVRYRLTRHLLSNCQPPCVCGRWGAARDLGIVVGLPPKLCYHALELSNDDRNLATTWLLEHGVMYAETESAIMTSPDARASSSSRTQQYVGVDYSCLRWLCHILLRFVLLQPEQRCYCR